MPRPNRAALRWARRRAGAVAGLRGRRTAWGGGPRRRGAPVVTSLKAFLLALQMMESSGDYRLVNSLNYLGAYQFGEAALVDLGYVRPDGNLLDNDYGGGWTGKDGIDSRREFLRSRSAQDRAAEAWLVVMWGYVTRLGLDRYAGQRVGDVVLTPSGMLGATHLLGPHALAEFIASDGTADLRDPYGTPIETYIRQLAGYDLPFAVPQD